MKKLIILMLTIVMVTAASAEKIAVNYRHPLQGLYRPHTVFFGGGFYPYYSPYYGYNPYFAPAPYYSYENRPSKLDLQIEDIKKDYEDKKWSVRHNDLLSGKEKRKEIRDLNHEMGTVVTDARKNYYKK